MAIRAELCAGALNVLRDVQNQVKVHGPYKRIGRRVYNVAADPKRLNAFIYVPLGWQPTEISIDEALPILNEEQHWRTRGKKEDS